MSSRQIHGEKDVLKGEQIDANKARVAKCLKDYRAWKRTAIGTTVQVSTNNSTIVSTDNHPVEISRVTENCTQLAFTPK